MAIEGSSLPHPGDGWALDLLDGREADFLLSILNASHDCVKLIDVSGAISFMNANGMCAMDIDDFASVARRPWPELWPEPMRPTLHEALARARAGERTSFEAECPTAKGRSKWWHVSVLPIRDSLGVIDKILASSRDITERVLREQDQRDYAAALERELAEKSDLLIQREFLMHEIDHRVKNSLAQVAAILRLQARRSADDVRAALDEAARRVGSIARVHELLQSSTDFQTIPVVPLLQRLCAEFTLTFDRPIQLTCTSQTDLPMVSERASALCIIVSELVTNAVRHGLGADPVTVDVRQTGQSAVLRVANTANRPRDASGSAASGLGTQICETYAHTLSGRLNWIYEAGRMTATLTFSPTL